MLRLNLIAEEAKQKLKFQRLYFLLLKTEIFLIILLILVGVIIFAAEKILSANIYHVGQETAKLINSSSNDYTVKARELNEKMATVAQIEGGFISYAQILRQIAVLIPEKVSLSYLNIDSETKTMEIRGLAPTRQDLLDLENNLKDAPWLTNVNVPLEEKFTKSNIPLKINFGFDITKIPAQ
jgi:Tfp pilus assembly protein PilN